MLPLSFLQSKMVLMVRFRVLLLLVVVGVVVIWKGSVFLRVFLHSWLVEFEFLWWVKFCPGCIYIELLGGFMGWKYGSVRVEISYWGWNWVEIFYYVQNCEALVLFSSRSLKAFYSWSVGVNDWSSVFQKRVLWDPGGFAYVSLRVELSLSIFYRAEGIWSGCFGDGSS